MGQHPLTSTRFMAKQSPGPFSALLQAFGIDHAIRLPPSPTKNVINREKQA
jgi:hypothetical protein